VILEILEFLVNRDHLDLQVFLERMVKMVTLEKKDFLAFLDHVGLQVMMDLQVL
jgi:hypothetical protein